MRATAQSGGSVTVEGVDLLYILLIVLVIVAIIYFLKRI
jgi:hypothetical protein